MFDNEYASLIILNQLDRQSHAHDPISRSDLQGHASD